MSSLFRLRRLIRHVTLASLAAAPMATACGGSTSDGDTNRSGVTNGDGGSSTDGGGADGATGEGGSDGGIDAAAFDTTVCTGETYLPLAGLSPGGTPPVSYVALRKQFDYGADAGVPANVLYQDGTACENASNVAACNSALTAASSTSGWTVPSLGNAPPSYRYLVYTRGDTVGLVKTLDELAQFLQPIDTSKEAALLAEQRGYFFVCPSNNARSTPGGIELIALSGHTCGAGSKLEEHRLLVGPAGAIDVLETTLIELGDANCAIGRRPSRLSPVERTVAADDALARFFSDVARLEAASIPAFEQLARDLAWHGAPRHLVDAALEARADEVRHARVTRDLAAAFGGSVDTPTVTIGAPRSLLEVALENAVEGCVRETFGALVASLQAARAKDASLAAAFEAIAEDETRHAALAWDLDAWLTPRLTESERAAVRRAREQAANQLRGSLSVEPEASVAATAGMPDARTATGAFDRLFEQLAA